MLRLGPPVYYWSKNNENNAYITVVFFFRNSSTLSPFFWKKCSNFIMVFCSQCPKRNRRNSLLKIGEISKKSFAPIISTYFFWWFFVSNHRYLVRLIFRKNALIIEVNFWTNKLKISEEIGFTYENLQFFLFSIFFLGWQVAKKVGGILPKRPEHKQK